jgi:hypothetical protein
MIDDKLMVMVKVMVTGTARGHFPPQVDSCRLKNPKDVSLGFFLCYLILQFLQTLMVWLVPVLNGYNSFILVLPHKGHVPRPLDGR